MIRSIRTHATLHMFPRGSYYKKKIAVKCSGDNTGKKVHLVKSFLKKETENGNLLSRWNIYPCLSASALGVVTCQKKPYPFSYLSLPLRLIFIVKLLHYQSSASSSSRNWPTDFPPQWSIEMLMPIHCTGSAFTHASPQKN